MMLHTKTLLVGEPAGAAQNMFSDYVNRGSLPHCGAALLISSEYFNIAWPCNKNFMIAPHYPAPFSSFDFFSGRDPALEAIYSGRAKALETVLVTEGPKAALNFFNEIKYDWRAHRDELCITPSTFPISSKYKGQSHVNDLGYSYLYQNKLDQAHDAFTLNITLFPHSFQAWDSYADYFIKAGDSLAAKKCYKTSLELNPSNQNALKMIERLGRD
jgi:tetratricopeptide (TPR) repeat protein